RLDLSVGDPSRFTTASNAPPTRGDLWEDFYDVLLAECSKTGITHAWEDVKAELKAMSEREAELHAELQGTD
ncbi:MAG: hypothetical protein O3A46_14815, partial [Candidatus Poribacteria bacterium]|nr:hypothetical protein [Candidatus Poribacteria bacterium]